jgi:hypothetical protein
MNEKEKPSLFIYPKIEERAKKAGIGRKKKKKREKQKKKE